MAPNARGLSRAAGQELIEFANSAVTRALGKEVRLTSRDLRGLCNKARADAEKARKDWLNAPADEKDEALGRYTGATAYAEIMCALAGHTP